MKRLLLVLVCTCLIFSACSRLDNPFSFESEVNGQGLFQIPFGETETFNAVEITFEKIADSRCPIGVICFWEGVADIELRLKSSSGEVEERICSIDLDLINDPCYVEIESMNLNLILLDVSPYPVWDDPVEEDEYVIQLQVDQL